MQTTPVQDQHALSLLGLEAGASKAAIQNAHQAKRSTIAKKLESAPTDALKQKFIDLQKQLDEARDLLLAASPAPKSPPIGASLSATKMADLPNAGPMGDDDQYHLLQPGQLLALRYEVQAQIGAGGMGAVYRALDRTTGQSIALKVLLPSLMKNEQARERFLDEARISQQLSHPNIVNVYDVQQDGDFFFLTMELLEGQDLRQVMENRKLAKQPFKQPEMQEISDQLCAALVYAHKYTVHRDLKPENVWLTENGEYKLMDFGIARVQSTSQRTQTGAAMGTAYYMAPEQLKGQKDIDGRADQYAMGVMLYELATGEVPAGLIKPVRQLRKDLSKSFGDAIMRTLNSGPAERFADIETFNQNLKKGGGLPALPWRGLAITAAFLAAVIGVGGVVASGNLNIAALEGLLPMSKEEKSRYRADMARVQGEIKVAKTRLETGRRNLDSDVRDAQRNESTDLNALNYWQQLTEEWIFGGSTISELEGSLSMGEALLRDESFEEAKDAFNRVKVGYQDLEENFKAGEHFYHAVGEHDAAKQSWTALGINSTPLHPEVAAATQVSEAAKLAQSEGALKTALTSWRKAADHWKNAKQAGDEIVVAKRAAQAAEASWLALKKQYNLRDPAEVKQARDLFVQAGEQLQQGGFDAAVATWKQSQVTWENAKTASKDQVAKVERDRESAAAAEAERQRLAAEAERERQRIENLKQQISELSITRNNLAAELEKRKAENERLMAEYWRIPGVSGTGGEISYSLSFFHECINSGMDSYIDSCRNARSNMRRLERLHGPYYDNLKRITNIPYEIADMDRKVNELKAQLK